MKKSEIKTLEEAKQYLRDNYEKGTECLCCKQRVQLYKRKLNAGMCYGLIALYRISNGNDFIHIPTEFTKRKINNSNTELSKLAYWGLIEEKKNEDSSKRTSGYWRITQRGIDFVNKKILLPRHALIYNGKCRGFTKEGVSIIMALGDKFNYDELMQGL